MRDMWKNALEKFIEKYKKDPLVEVILLVGSYAVGNQNDLSDIDVYIILNDRAKYRERGNLRVDNYLIEYFINPLNKVLEYMKKDKRGHGGAMANMIINGKVLYDKNNRIPKLKRQAEYYKNKANKKNNLLYYACWDAYDEYKAAAYHNELQYFLCIERLIEAYLVNNNYNMIPILKAEKIVKDLEYQRKYNIGKLPNNDFNNLLINCFNKIDEKNLKKLYDFVIKDGNFDINNFKNREKI